MPVITFVAQHAGLFLAAPFVLIPLSAPLVHSGSKGVVAFGLAVFAGGALSIILLLASIPYL